MGEAIISRRGGGGSLIKSMQEGTVVFVPAELTIDIPINAVDPSKTIVMCFFSYDSGALSPASSFFTIDLTSATTIRLTKSEQYRNTTGPLLWRVIEFSKVKSLQKGNVTATSSFPTEIPINSVNINKSLAYASIGMTGTNEFAAISYTIYFDFLPKCRFVNNTTLNVYWTGKNDQIYWQVVEFD